MGWTCRAITLVLLVGCGRHGFGRADDADLPTIDGVVGDGDGDGSTAPRWPNQPPGCTQLTQPTFEALPPAGWSIREDTRLTLASDPTSPFSPPSVVQFEYQLGDGPGAPGALTFGPSELRQAAVQELYVGLMWKPSAPWDGHASGSNTILYLKQNDGSTNHTLRMRGADAPYHLGMTIKGSSRDPNLASGTIVLGAWHKLELRMRKRSGAVAADGVVSWWLDGEPIGHHTDADVEAAMFHSVAVEPYWGGAGDTKTSTDQFWFDDVVVCISSE
jgi:hypothetical protein